MRPDGPISPLCALLIRGTLVVPLEGSIGSPLYREYECIRSVRSLAHSRALALKSKINFKNLKCVLNESELNALSPRDRELACARE